MLKKWVFLLSLTATMLTACNSPVYNQTEGNVADVKIKTKEARIKSDTDALPKAPLVVKSGAYVDMTPISIAHDPAWLKNHIVVRGDQLPFSYYSRVVANGAAGNILTKYQVGLDPSTSISVNYSGTIKGALDVIAAKSGYVYTVSGNTVYWQAFVTKTFDVAFMPGGTDYLMGKASSSGQSTANTASQGSNAQVSNYVSSDSSDSEYSSLKGTLSIWKDLDTTIKQMMSPDGKVMVSESTTSVTVRDRPTNVQLIGQYIENLNRNISKQVLVKVQVLEVRLNSDFEFGIDWGLITKAFHNSPFNLNANYGTPVAITSLAAQSGLTGTLPAFGTQGNGQIPSYTILFNSLNQQGKTSVVSEPRVVCLNNQVSVIRIVSSQGYAASVQNTTLSGGSSGSSNIGTVTSQITPGTVITGLTLYILPKIMKENVYLQVNADLSTNDGFTSFGPSGSTNPNQATIQLPNITEKHFNQRSMIRSGDTLILSGFRQVKNRAGAMQFLTSQAMGGKGSTQENSETIVLITPIILNGSA